MSSQYSSSMRYNIFAIALGSMVLICCPGCNNLANGSHPQTPKPTSDSFFCTISGNNFYIKPSIDKLMLGFKEKFIICSFQQEDRNNKLQTKGFKGYISIFNIYVTPSSVASLKEWLNPLPGIITKATEDVSNVSNVKFRMGCFTQVPPPATIGEQLTSEGEHYGLQCYQKSDLNSNGWQNLDNDAAMATKISEIK